MTKKRAVPLWFRGFKSSFKTWDQFHDAFHAFQSETYQRFTTRSTTSVPIRNKQIVTSSKARKRAGKKPKKDVTLIPEKDWKIYSKTLVCTHRQPYEPKGKGKRNHNRVRDTKCMARVNVRVTMTLSGSWYLCVNASDGHNHTLNKHSFESYAENRTVKDVELTRAVATLHRAGANAQCILRYLRERTGWFFKFGADLVCSGIDLVWICYVCTGKKPFLEMFIIWCNGTKLLRKLD
ncbi:hypothetical protein PHMEG_00034763 [Phytophthora megakarya]|uniref:FAR1 domain-containing protein n=1 Tax=Phytophthora megakarya TaxID=4795 RepID=A0A225UQD7_9STRA|nr:hypothetical protein PHMEG_00034763 [Phytophthora megakarya]